MADYRNSVGYLQLRANNVQRQQAIADATTNQIGQETDVGGKALGVMQDMVGDARKVRDRDFERDTRLGVAKLGQDGLLNRLQLKASGPVSEKDRSIIDLNNARRDTIGRDDTRADTAEGRQERALQQKGYSADQIAAYRAVSLAIEQQKADAAIWAAGAQDTVPRGYQPVTPTPGGNQAIVAPPQGSPAPSGPAPAAAHILPSLQPAAQPAAPDAAKPAVTINTPPQMPPADPNSIPLSTAQMNEARNKVGTSNEQLRDLDDVISVLEGKDPNLKPDPTDFGAKGGGISVLGLTPNSVQSGYGKVKDLVGGTAVGQMLGIGSENPQLQASNRRTAIGQRINVPLNKIMKRYGSALTDTELGRGMGEAGIQKALGGEFDVFASELPQLIEAMKYLRQKAIEEGGVAGKEAQTHRRQVSATTEGRREIPLQASLTEDQADARMDELQAQGLSEDEAYRRVKMELGLEGPKAAE